MRFTRIVGRKSVVAGIAVAAAVGLGGTAYAATDPGGTNPALPGSGGTVDPAVHSNRPRTLLGRTDHATLELKVKGQWVTYTMDRGEVTAVSPSSITLARPDGQSVTETINSATRFGGVTSEAGVRLSHRAAVISDNGVALRIRQAG